MSLKDDFLEALRSVKRDFFKDYEYTSPTSEQSRPEQTLSSEPVAHTPYTEFPPPPVQQPESASVFDNIPADDKPAFFSNEKPFAQELQDDVLHSAESDEDDEESFAPDVDTTPFRTAMDFDVKTDSEPEPTEVLNPQQEDRRFIFDGYDSPDSLTDDRTIISKNTVIRGALQTEDSVRMFGQILGDIECKSNILVAGKVRGNTSAANAYVIDAQVDGNLLCDDVINITDDAWILGNIRAQQADIDGKIKGNIEIRHMITIGANSSVIGNISTDEIEIKRGAFINGQIMMYSPSRDVIDRFERFER